jgi:hypothetical protein
MQIEWQWIFKSKRQFAEILKARMQPKTSAKLKVDLRELKH